MAKSSGPTWPGRPPATAVAYACAAMPFQSSTGSAPADPAPLRHTVTTTPARLRSISFFMWTPPVKLQAGITALNERGEPDRVSRRDRSGGVRRDSSRRTGIVATPLHGSDTLLTEERKAEGAESIYGGFGCQS